MLDKPKLFKVFLSLSRDKNYFKVAQDAYPILLCMKVQLEQIEATIAEYAEKIDELASEEGKATEIAQFESSIQSLEEMLTIRDGFQSLIASKMPLAQEIWFCGPVDKVGSSLSDDNRQAIERWRIYRGHEDEITDELKAKIDDFKNQCLAIVQENFAALFEENSVEEEADAAAWASIPHTDFKHASTLPLGVLREFEESNNSMSVVTDFPISHLLVVDEKFAGALGYTVARCLVMPVMTFVVNTADTSHLIDNLNSDVELAGSATVIFYRSIDQKVIEVAWEICNHLINGHVMARGINITKMLSAARNHKASDTEQLLRRWLHSIRNASFQQQAEVISQDVEDLRKKVGSGTFKAEFDSIKDGINTLIYTTRASVGLIDQVLDSKGLSHFSPLKEFVKAIIQFPINFANSEGIPNFQSHFQLYLNGVLANPDALDEQYVKGDLSSLTTIIDNVFSNAVRYTNASQGVAAKMNIHIHDASVQLALEIIDHCPGGLPDHIVKYLQKHISHKKVVDLRRKGIKRKAPDTASSSSESVYTSPPMPGPTGSARSSLTGIPHIAEMYHELTRSGETDFGLVVTTNSTGTTFLISSMFELIAPPKVFEANSTIEGLAKINVGTAADDRVVLIVDDSHVVRRLFERYMSTLGMPFHSCKDGVEALEWFRENHAKCRGIVTDLEMPKMGGDALITSVLETHPQFPCVVVSGNNIAAAKIPNGAIKAVLKPITLDQVRDVVSDMQQHEEYCSSNTQS